MEPKPEQQGQSGLGDPRLEFARLVGEQDKRPTREECLPEGPPPVVDADFCFDEESES